MKEQQIQKKILQKLTKDGAYAVKIISATKRGVPDIIACYKRFFIGIEVKRENVINAVTPLQQKNLDEIKKAGGYSFAAIGYDDFLEKWYLIKKDINKEF